MERVRPAQKPGIGDLDLPVRRIAWQSTIGRPLSCDVVDRDVGNNSSHWGQDFLGQSFFPLSCPTLDPNVEQQASSASSAQPLSLSQSEETVQQSCLDFNYEDFLKREEKLLVKVREFMESPKHNPERGSIPSERVQNCIKQKHKELYNFVVSTVYANQWHRFIRKHDDVFELIFSKTEGRSLPRIRLRTHQDYERADQKEEDERRRREYVIRSCLKQYLQDHNEDVRVEEFRNEYQRWLAEDPGFIKTCDDKWRKPEHPPFRDPPPVLPRFRDIIRIVKRYPQDFAYDPNAEGAGQNARIRSAANWKPGEHFCSPALAALRKESEELQVPNSAPARISLKSITFTIPSEDGVLLPIPQSGPLSHLSRPESAETKPVADADPVWQFQERERRLVKEIVDFLDSKEWNPNKGSVPSERVQNCIKGKYPGLYRSVVGAYYSNQWHRFIQTHGGPEGFELFLVQDGKRAVWRIRLEKHTNYKEADELEKQDREKNERHLLHCLLLYLQKVGGSCKVDEFITEYETQVTDRHELPKRGDFVRFVRRYVEYFDYDSKEYIISCAKSVNGDVVEMDPPPIMQRVVYEGPEPGSYVHCGDLVLFLQQPVSRLYQLSRRQWLDMPFVGPQPKVRQQSLVAREDGSVFCFGGWVEQSLATYSDRLHLLNVWPPEEGQQEVPAGVWKEMLSAGDLPSARSLHSAVLKDNVMYVLGGQDENGPVDMDLHAYDLSANTWTQLSVEGERPTPRCGHAAHVRGDQMVVLGGTEALDHLHILDFRSLRWRRQEVVGVDLPPAADLRATVLCRNSLYVFAGTRAWALHLDASPPLWQPVVQGDGDTEPVCAVVEQQGQIFQFVMEPTAPVSPSLTFERPLTTLSCTDAFMPSYGTCALDHDEMDFRRPETIAVHLPATSHHHTDR
eukprot:EG_transcript_1492